MGRKQRPQVEEIDQLLYLDVPTWRLDAERTVIRANLLMLWAYGNLRIGEVGEPGRMIGQHAYEPIARSIEEGRISLEDPDNSDFIVMRLRGVLGKPDEQLPAVQRFLELVYATPEDRRRWEAAIAAHDGYGDPLALDERHYPVCIQHPGGPRLHFMVSARRLADGGRLTRYEPWLQDKVTVDAVKSASEAIKAVYPDVDYVQDKSNLTVFSPDTGHDVIPAQSTMTPETSEHERPGRSEATPDNRVRHRSDSAARDPLLTTRTPATEWRPAQIFPREAIDQTFGQRSESLPLHPVFGAGFAWELAVSSGKPTRIEIFPDRRWATLRYLDGSLQQRERGVILDYVTVRTDETPPVLSMVSERDGRGSLINVYPSGEVDEYFRLQPATPALPPEALIFGAPASAPPVAPADPEQPAVTVAEAAQQLGTGPEHVRVLLRAHRLAGFKRGGSWYVPTDALAEFQASRRRTGGRGPEEVREEVATYNQTYYEQKKQDPTWRERRRAQARAAMRRKRERERDATSQ